MDLKGKNVIITGASRGIGKSIAVKLAESEDIPLVTTDLPLDDLTKKLSIIGEK